MSRLPDPASLDRPWLAGYPPGVPATYQLPDVALPRFLDDAARDFPDRPAIVAGAATVDYASLRDDVAAVAAGLAALGVASGDRVLLAVPLGRAYPILLFAIWRLGAVAVPVEPGASAAALTAIAADATVVAAAATPAVLQQFAERDALPRITVAVAGDEWSRRRFGRLALKGRFARVLRRRRHGAPEASVPLADVLASPGSTRPVEAVVASTPALLAYHAAAATAGPARGVVLTHANLVAGAFQVRLWIPDVQAGRDRVLLADGLHDVAAVTLGLLTGVLAAAALVLLDDPDAGTVARAIERSAPTLFPTVPSRVAGLLADSSAAGRDLTSLRVCLAVGAPLDPRVAADMERRTAGARVREVYGLVEAGRFTHAQPVYGRIDPGTIGLPVIDTVAAVVDPDDLATPRTPGEPGILLVAGPQVARGYWRRPDDTARAFRDGWLITDDLVSVDGRGVFTHVGRVDEVVAHDGVLVSPRRVERVLEGHPAVRRAGVVLAGDQLTAAVVARRRPRVTEEELLAHCRVHLDVAAVPDQVALMDELPVNEAGDLARDVLRRTLAGR